MVTTIAHTRTLVKGHRVHITADNIGYFYLPDKKANPKWAKFCSLWLTYKNPEWEVYAKLANSESVYISLIRYKHGQRFLAKVRFSHHPTWRTQGQEDLFYDATDKTAKAAFNKVTKAWKKFEKNSSLALA